MPYDRDGNYFEDQPQSGAQDAPTPKLSLKKAGDDLSKIDFSSKPVLIGGLAGFGYAILMGKSKILWTLVGAVGMAFLTHAFKAATPVKDEDKK